MSGLIWQQAGTLIFHKVQKLRFVLVASKATNY
jgi:hypothetical protein